jgi:hypothetical protein
MCMREIYPSYGVGRAGGVRLQFNFYTSLTLFLHKAGKMFHIMSLRVASVLLAAKQFPLVQCHCEARSSLLIIGGLLRDEHPRNDSKTEDCFGKKHTPNDNE